MTAIVGKQRRSPLTNEHDQNPHSEMRVNGDLSARRSAQKARAQCIGVQAYGEVWDGVRMRALPKAQTDTAPKAVMRSSQLFQIIFIEYIP